MLCTFSFAEAREKPFHKDNIARTVLREEKNEAEK